MTRFADGRSRRGMLFLLRYFNPMGAHKSGRIGEASKGYSEQSDAIYYAGG